MNRPAGGIDLRASPPAADLFADRDDPAVLDHERRGIHHRSVPDQETRVADHQICLGRRRRAGRQGAEENQGNQARRGLHLRRILAPAPGPHRPWYDSVHGQEDHTDPTRRLRRSLR